MLLHQVPAVAAHHARPGLALHFDGLERSYAEFAERCARLSRALAHLAPAGSRVSILSTNRLEYVECLFGVPGARLVLNPLNWRLAPRELAYILADASPAVLMVEARFLDTVRPLLAEVPSLQWLVVLDESGAAAAPVAPPVTARRAGFTADPPAGAPGPGLAAMSYEALLALAVDDARDPAAGAQDDDLAWLMYTSGTTGRPKGAMLTHRNLMASSTNTLIAFEMGPGENALFMFPMFHVAAYVFIGYLLLGYGIVLMRQFEVEGYLATVQRHRITAHAIAPTMLAMVLEHPRLDDRDTSSLRRITYGASAMPPEILRAALARWPQVGFGTGFGMTELAGNVVFFGAQAHRDALDREPAALVACGREMPLSRVRIIDDAGNDVPVDAPGEIAVKGDQVFAGYWNRPDATAESFVDGWFRTGDVGRRDAQGRLYVVDRKKDMILTGGENVYSREVEDLLYEHPAVAEAAVIGTPDLQWGERVTAVIRLKPADERGASAGSSGNATASAPSEVALIAELEAFCRPRIAGYKRPRRWLFVDALPKSAAGKILKAQLRTELRDRWESR